MTIIRDIEKALEKWPIWVGIILLFVPGLMFKLQRNFPVSEYSGSLVIILLMVSLYYSIPFLIMGFFYSVAFLYKEKLDKESLLYITVMGVVSYMVINLTWNLIQNNYFQINFWIIYFFILGFTFLLGIKNWIKLFRKK